MSSCSYFLYLYMVFLKLFSRTVLNVLYIIRNSQENFKLIEYSPQINPVEELITYCYSDSSISYHIESCIRYCGDNIRHQ